VHGLTGQLHGEVAITQNEGTAFNILLEASNAT